jgi:hypothetical protein
VRWSCLAALPRPLAGPVPRTRVSRPCAAGAQLVGAALGVGYSYLFHANRRKKQLLSEFVRGPSPASISGELALPEAAAAPPLGRCMRA